MSRHSRSSSYTGLPVDMSMYQRPTLSTAYYAGGMAAGPMQSYDPYAVGGLAMPPTGAAGGPGGPGGGLPPQHRASSGAWAPQDDANLIQARAQGLNWAQIQQAYFGNKTPNACRKRHERLMERRGADDWDARKLEKLAREYMNMRKEIWAPLAQRTGEKWNVVEQKCMSNGLKNLQSAARAAARRERIESGQPLTAEDYDSGVSGIDMEGMDELDGAYQSSPDTNSSNASSGAGSAFAAPAMQHNPSYQSYYSASSAGHGGYNGSVSSSGTAQGYSSQQASPYMGHGARMSSADMGIDAIINRPGGAASNPV